MTNKEAATELRECHNEHVELLGRDDPQSYKYRVVAILAGAKACEKLAWLETKLAEETKEAGQHHDHFQACEEYAYGNVLEYIRTGEEW